VMASLHKNRRTTLERIEKFVSRIYFTDVNLYGRIYPHQENVGTRKHSDVRTLITH
jgi:alpha-mannosidase